MRRFKYSLESVLTIKKKALEDERIKLASIINVLNKQNDVLNGMLFSLSQTQSDSQKCLENEFDISQIINYNSFSIKLVQDIKMQKKIIERTQIELLRQQEVVKQVYIKVKSLENLKEKQKEQYNKELLAEEYKILDDVLSSRRITA